MPATALLAPPALLALAALLTWALGVARVHAGREVCSVAAWLALAVLLLAWLGADRTPLELSPSVRTGIALGLRLDAVAFAFGVFILLPLALQLTFQPRNWQEAGVAALAAAASLVAVLAGNLVLAALGLGTAGSLVMAQLRQEHPRGSENYWVALTGAWLLLLWAGATLEAVTGTSAYAAVPVSSVAVPLFLLLAAAALLSTGLLPWRTWTGEVFERPRLQAGALALALLRPLGFYLLVRGYAMGAGQWPSPWLNMALGALGVLTALAAGLRGQAAATRRGHLAEVLPLSGGLVLFALSLGTPLGLAAAMLGLTATALVTGLLPLLPEGARADAWLGIAIMAGLPPGLVFVARLLALDAAFEARNTSGLLALVAAAAWLLGFAGAARAIRLPDRPQPHEPSGSSVGTLIGVGAGLAGGAAAGALGVYLAAPAAAEAMGVSVATLRGGGLSLVTAAGVWPAVTLAGPLLVLLLLLAVFARPAWSAAVTEPERTPAPLFRIRGAGLGERAWTRLAGAQLPAEYRSLFDPGLLERALSRPRPWLWTATVAALAFVVTR